MVGGDPALRQGNVHARVMICRFMTKIALKSFKAPTMFVQTERNLFVSKANLDEGEEQLKENSRRNLIECRSDFGKEDSLKS